MFQIDNGTRRALGNTKLITHREQREVTRQQCAGTASLSLAGEQIQEQVKSCKNCRQPVPERPCIINLSIQQSQIQQWFCIRLTLILPHSLSWSWKTNAASVTAYPPHNVFTHLLWCKPITSSLRRVWNSCIEYQNQIYKEKSFKN